MPNDVKVKQGDCILSISLEYGFFPETIWNHEKNSKLKEDRKDPNVLMPGDVVHVPDKRAEEISKPDQKRHRFRRKGVPATFRVQVNDVSGPMANLGYRLEVDGATAGEGKTDGDGWIESTIPLNAKQAVVFLENDLVYEFKLGSLDPIDTVEGVQQRLASLGYYNGADDGKTSPETRGAIEAFQGYEELDVTGKIDDATRQRLKERCE